MSQNAPDPNQPKAGGLWARLMNAKQDEETNEQQQQNQDPAQESPPLASRMDEASQPEAVPDLSLDTPDDPPEVPLAQPIPETPAEPAEPVVEAVPAEPTAESFPPVIPVDPEKAEEPESVVEATLAEVSPSESPTGEFVEVQPQEAPPEEAPPAESAEPAAPPAEKACPACAATVPGNLDYCPDCGFMFSGNEAATSSGIGAASSKAFTPPQTPVRDRYKFGGMVSERMGIARFRGQDFKDSSGQPKPVIIVVGPKSADADTPAAAGLPTASVEENNSNPELTPFDDDNVAVADIPQAPEFPSVSWEKFILENTFNPAIPKVLDHFAEGDFEYLIEEDTQGDILWDAWDDPDANYSKRYSYLIKLAEGLHELHQAGAMVEGLRPELVTVTPEGQPVLSDLTDLLPLPLPANVPVRGTLYTAPELIVSPDKADARAEIYSFGAMLYSLEYLHHALEEKDFESQFYPKLITDRYPDVHPAFNRLILKTFNRDLNNRFPTDGAAKKDPTGMLELISTLKVCKRTFERVRMDIAAWTTTGMIRTGNEDAFAFLHAVESREDELTEYALILLTDGMGGYEAGEVAAAMAIHSMREFLLQHPIFAAVAGKEKPDDEKFDIEECKKLLHDALIHANNVVFTASRAPGSGKRGMGCTAEAIYIDDRHLVVGHVGDSRTYHITNASLKQLTRDHTLVNRLVELGMISAEEAEDHDRKNELQQAIGGQPTVEPGCYHANLSIGDWVIVCSDGLTNHVPDDDLAKMLLRESSGSAEDAARRLLNLVNLRGATDNTTMVLVRCS